MFSEGDGNLQGILTYPGGRMNGWCANDVLHICDEERAEFLQGALSDQGVIAELCTGGTPCP